MRFDAYTYLFPPRPENAIPRSMIEGFEKRGYVAQCKMNGTCNVLAVTPDRSLRCMTRHKTPHKLWSPSKGSAAAFQGLPGKGWYVFTAELLHSKVPGIRDVNYIHDIVVADGVHLVGRSFSARQQILADLFSSDFACEMPSHHVIDAHTWVSKTVTTELGVFFDRLINPEHEGIVLKNPKAPLALGAKPTSNGSWSVKCRRPHANYAF